MSSDRYIAIDTFHEPIGPDGECAYRVDVHAKLGIISLDTVCGIMLDWDGDSDKVSLPKRPKITCVDCRDIILRCRTYTRRDFTASIKERK